jgi:hypothetical protein
MEQFFRFSWYQSDIHGRAQFAAALSVLTIGSVLMVIAAGSFGTLALSVVALAYALSMTMSVIALADRISDYKHFHRSKRHEI